MKETSNSGEALIHVWDSFDWVPSHFSIQGRPTEYLFFESVSGERIQVASTGEAREIAPADMDHLRSAGFDELLGNQQFVAALEAATRYAVERGWVINDFVSFD